MQFSCALLERSELGRKLFLLLNHALINLNNFLSVCCFELSKSYRMRSLQILNFVVKCSFLRLLLLLVTVVELLDRSLILLGLNLKFLALITLYLLNHLVLLSLQEFDLCLIPLVYLLDLALVSSLNGDESALILRPTNDRDVLCLNRLQLAGTVLLEVLNLGVVSLNLLFKLGSVGCALACELGLVCLV